MRGALPCVCRAAGAPPNVLTGGAVMADNREQYFWGPLLLLCVACRGRSVNIPCAWAALFSVILPHCNKKPQKTRVS